MNKGKLYLIPTSITGEALLDILPKKDLDIIATLEYFIVETAKIARRNLKGAQLVKPIQEIEFNELNKRTKQQDVEYLLQPILDGKDMGLMSDAGAPTIADPGWRLVLKAQEQGIEIVPMVGPSSIFLALMASGLNGQRFVFHGYLSKEGDNRRADIRKIESQSRNSDQTQIFMEAPYKNQHVLEDLLAVCQDNTLLCIAKNITGEDGFVKTMPIYKWKSERVDLNKIPTLFLLYARKEFVPRRNNNRRYKY